MINEQKWVKSDLEQRLESEGWKLLTNLQKNEPYVIGGKSVNVINCIRNKYGAENIKIDIAYDCDGKIIKDMHAVYVKESAIAENKGE